MKRWHIYLIIAIMIVATFLIFGARIGGLITALLGGGVANDIRKQKKTIEQKEEDYEMAGDGIEAKKHTDHESAANVIDDILDDNNSSK